MDIFQQVAEMELEEARQKAKEEVARELIAGTEFSDEKIAALTHIKVRKVAAIRKEMLAK